MGEYIQVGSEGLVNHFLGVNHGWGLASPRQSLSLEEVVSVPIRVYFALRVFCLSYEASWQEEIISKV